MRKFRNCRPASSRQQSGMTLLVGLILLLMLSVLSTIGFRNTTLSERMTGNSVDRNVSFQSAESAGKEALQLIVSTNPHPISFATTGHYAVPLALGGTTNFWTQGDGVVVGNVANCPTTAPFSWISCSASVATTYKFNSNIVANTTSISPQYAIELLTQVSGGGSTVWTYRVTSRSTGALGS